MNKTADKTPSSADCGTEATQLNPNSNDDPHECTKWHWIIFVIVPFIALFEGLLPHSFGTLIAFLLQSRKVHTPNPTEPPQITNKTLPSSKVNEHSTFIFLDSITTFSSALIFFLVPFLLIVVRRCPGFSQYFNFIGFLLLGVSCATSSVVPNHAVLFLTYSILYGAAGSLIVANFIHVLADYFPVTHRWHVVATSLYQMGYPLASGIGNPFLAYLINIYGWRVSLKILGAAMCCVAFVFSGLLKPKSNETLASALRLRPSSAETETKEIELSDPSDESKETIKGEKKSINNNRTTISLVVCSTKQLLATPQLYTWLIAKAVNYMCWFALRTNFISYYTSYLNLSLQQSSNLMAIYAGGEIFVAFFGTLVLGRYLRGYLVHVHMVSTLGLGILFFIWNIFVTSLITGALGAFLVGIILQFSLSFGYPASQEVLGWEMGMAWSVTNLSGGIGVALSPLLGGYVADTTGSFYWMFPVLGGVCIFETLLYFITWIIIRVYGTANNIEEYEKLT